MSITQFHRSHTRYMRLTYWEGLELLTIAYIERLKHRAPTDCFQIVRVSTFTESMMPSQTIIRLTFREELEITTTHKIEILQGLAVSDGCETIGHYCETFAVQKGPHVRLTLWKGLQLLAIIEGEVLQCGALADGCENKCQ